MRISPWQNTKLFVIKIVKAYIKMYGGVGPEVQFGKRKDSDLVSHKLNLIQYMIKPTIQTTFYAEPICIYYTLYTQSEF